MVIDDPGGRRGLGRRAQRTGGDGFDEGGVKSRMYPKSGGELQTYGHRIDDLHHHIRADVSGSQLLGLDLEWKVSGEQPYPLPRRVSRGSSTSAVGYPLIPGCCANQCCPSLPPDSPAAA